MEAVSAFSFESRPVAFAGAGCIVYIPRMVRTDTTTYMISEEMYSEGTYGLTYLTNDGFLVKFVPAIEEYQPETEIVEMKIHKQIEEIAKEISMPEIVPKLHTVFLTKTMPNAKETIGFVMEHLRGPNLTTFLSTRLMKLVPHTDIPVGSYDSLIRANDNLILTVLAQIAGILLPLQNAIEFNHRDLHGQNIIMCQSTTTQKITICDKSVIIPTIGGYWPKFIDLGFSRTRDYTTISIFNEEPWKSNFLAGRDLCHLVYYLLVYVIGTDPSKGPRGTPRRIPISAALRKWLISLVTIRARQHKNGPLVKICLVWPGAVWDDFTGKLIRFNAAHESREMSWTNIYLVLNSLGIEADASTPEQILRYYAERTHNNLRERSLSE